MYAGVLSFCRIDTPVWVPLAMEELGTQDVQLPPDQKPPRRSEYESVARLWSVADPRSRMHH